MAACVLGLPRPVGLGLGPCLVRHPPLRDRATRPRGSRTAPKTPADCYPKIAHERVDTGPLTAGVALLPMRRCRVEAAERCRHMDSRVVVSRI